MPFPSSDFSLLVLLVMHPYPTSAPSLKPKALWPTLLFLWSRQGCFSGAQCVLSLRYLSLDSAACFDSCVCHAPPPPITVVFLSIQPFPRSVPLFLLGPQTAPSSHPQLHQAMWFSKPRDKSRCFRERSVLEVRKREDQDTGSGWTGQGGVGKAEAG